MSTIVIIGASRGIGLELARQYAAAGDRVIATARSDAGAEHLHRAGVQQILRVDVAKPASVSGLAWQLDGESVDVAIYVAGVGHRADATSPPTQNDFDRVMHTNVLGAMQVIPQVAPLVEAGRNGQGGVFGFISSGLGNITQAADSDWWLYRVSKAALNMAVASARHSYPRAAMVCLDPGWVRTDMGGPSAPLSAEDSAAALRRNLTQITLSSSGHFVRRDGVTYDTW